MEVVGYGVGAARWNSIGVYWALLWTPEMGAFRSAKRFIAVAID